MKKKKIARVRCSEKGEKKTSSYLFKKFGRARRRQGDDDTRLARLTHDARAQANGDAHDQRQYDGGARAAGAGHRLSQVVGARAELEGEPGAKEGEGH